MFPQFAFTTRIILITLTLFQILRRIFVLKLKKRCCDNFPQWFVSEVYMPGTGNPVQIEYALAQITSCAQKHLNPLVLRIARLSPRRAIFYCIVKRKTVWTGIRKALI